MAISDINKAMALYAQPTQFDQNAWKTAFDIANSFNKTSDGYTTMADNRRKYQENLDTQLWRTAATNAQNKTIVDTAPYTTQANNAKSQYIIDTTPWNIKATNAQNKTIATTEPQHAQALNAQYDSQMAQYNLQTNQYNGQNELLKFQGAHGFDPITGAAFGVNDLRRAAQKENLSPYAIVQLQTPEAKINQSNQVDLRNIQSALDKAYQDALDVNEDGIPVLNKEKFAAGMARNSAVYGADHPVLVEFMQRVAAQNGWSTQPQTQPQGNNTQGGVPVGGIPAPVAPAPQQQATPTEQNAVATQPTQVVASPATFTEPQTDSVYVKKWAEELDMNEETARKQLTGMLDVMKRGGLPPEDIMQIFNSRLRREKERKARLTQQQLYDALIKSEYATYYFK